MQINNKKKNLITVSNVLSDFKDGYTYIKRNNFLYFLSLFSIGLNFFFAIGYTVPLPYIVVNVLHFTSAQYGIILSSASIGAFSTSLLLSTVLGKLNVNKLYKIFSSLIAIIIIIIGVTSTPFIANLPSLFVLSVLVACGFLFGTSVVMVSIPVNVLIQERTENQYQGRVQGILKSAASMMTPIGMLISGKMLDIIPAYYVCISSGILMLVNIIVLSRYRKKEIKTERMDK